MVHVNGELRPLDAGQTVADVVAAVTPSPKGVAVAVNGEIVPRSAWPDHELHDGDRVEVLSAHQGG